MSEPGLSGSVTALKGEVYLKRILPAKGNQVNIPELVVGRRRRQ